MAVGPQTLALTPNRHRTTWLGAAAGSLLLNLGLFALMPYLLHQTEERPIFDKLIPQVNVVRIKRPETPVERKAAKRPEPVRAKAAPPPATPSGRTAPANLKLAFEVNPHLSGGPVVTEVPAVKMTDFSQANLSALVDSAELDRPLIPLSRMPPVYPLTAKRRGIEGWVRVRFVVDAEGRVQEVTVIEAEPDGIFDETVTRCVYGWRFKPGTVDGIPVSAWAETTVRFELE